MKVYLVRHGETHANAQKRFAGHWDINLTDKGIGQAHEAAEKLRDVSFTRVMSSDLQRARITAETILKYHENTLEINPELREMNFGIWEEKTFAEIGANDPVLLKKWFDDYKNFGVPEGESVQILFDRVVGAYEKLVEGIDRESDTNVLIVAHGGVIQCLMSYFCFGNLEGYWKFRIDNCAVNCVEYAMGMPVIKALNQ